MWSEPQEPPGKEAVLPGGNMMPVVKRQTIQDFSTRQHHAGLHRVETLVNGQPMGGGEFQLVRRPPC